MTFEKSPPKWVAFIALPLFTGQEWSVTPREKSHCMLFTLSDFGRIDVKIGKSTSCQFPGTKDGQWRLMIRKLYEVVSLSICQWGLQDWSIFHFVWRFCDRLFPALKSHWFDITVHINGPARTVVILRSPLFGQLLLENLRWNFRCPSRFFTVQGFRMLLNHSKKMRCFAITLQYLDGTYNQNDFKCILDDSWLNGGFHGVLTDKTRVPCMAGILMSTGWTPSNKADSRLGSTWVGVIDLEIYGEHPLLCWYMDMV